MKQTLYKPKRASKIKHDCWSSAWNWVDRDDYARNEVVLCDCGQMWIAKWVPDLQFSWKMRKLQKWRINYWRIDRSEA